MRHFGWMRRRCGIGGCGFNSFLGFNSCNCARAVGYAPSPLYVVNQGPEYTGPGLMVPYQSYSPGAAFAPAINYPYIGSTLRLSRARLFSPCVYRGPRYAYRAHVYVRPRYYRARPYLYR